MTTAVSTSPVSLRSQYIMFRDCWHLVNYLPRSEDAVSQSVLSYKQQDKLIAERWNNLAAKRVAELNIQPDYIVRALGSREMVCTGGRPLDQLCFKLAKAFDITYNPFLLMKKNFTIPLHRLSKKKRIRELDNQYVFNMLRSEKERPQILIIDDIVTTGTTMLAIRECIRQVLPKSDFYFFTLARTVGNY